jgi:hypothetical protein
MSLTNLLIPTFWKEVELRRIHQHPDQPNDPASQTLTLKRRKKNKGGGGGGGNRRRRFDKKTPRKQKQSTKNSPPSPPNCAQPAGLLPSSPAARIPFTP